MDDIMNLETPEYAPRKLRSRSWNDRGSETVSTGSGYRKKHEQKYIGI